MYTIVYFSLSILHLPSIFSWLLHTIKIKIKKINRTDRAVANFLPHKFSNLNEVWKSAIEYNIIWHTHIFIYIHLLDRSPEKVVMFSYNTYIIYIYIYVYYVYYCKTSQNVYVNNNISNSKIDRKMPWKAWIAYNMSKNI